MHSLQALVKKIVTSLTTPSFILNRPRCSQHSGVPMHRVQSSWILIELYRQGGGSCSALGAAKAGERELEKRSGDATA